MCDLGCVAPAAPATPAWGARAVPRRGIWGGAVRLQRRGKAVLLPPPRAGRPGVTLEDWCPTHGREDLLEEWDDPSKGPHDVNRGSKEKVWWKCGKDGCGHRWSARVGNRTTLGTGCPACAGRVPTAAHNFEVYCQETGREELLEEWADRSRRPKDSLPGSGVKVPWQCGECEHTWVASLNHRTNNGSTGCPACARRVATPTFNLAVWCGKNGRADLLGQWAHPVKAPTDFTRASNAKVPWKCGECGSGWDALISNRTSNHTGCPACNPGGRPRGEVPTPTDNFEVWCGENGREELLGEWADGSSKPKDFTPRSRAKVLWKCRECEHTWVTPLSSRTSSNRSGCPACAGEVNTATNNLAVWCGKTGREDLLGEWAHADKASTDFTPASEAKVPWKCGECGSRWDARISDRTRSDNPRGCPACAGRVAGAYTRPSTSQLNLSRF